MINNISNRSNPYFGAKISFDPYFDRHPRVKVPTPYDQFVKGLYYLSDSEVKDVEKLLDKLNNTAKVLFYSCAHVIFVKLILLLGVSTMFLRL